MSRPSAAGEQGVTLIECLVVCAVAVLLAGAALPSLLGTKLRSGRLDAVAALTRVQTAQEQHHSLQGLYAAELQALGGISAQSPQGLYTLTLALTGPESYRATATPRGQQAQDRPCPSLTLDVNMGFPSEGPESGCWQR